FLPMIFSLTFKTSQGFIIFRKPNHSLQLGKNKYPSWDVKAVERGVNGAFTKEFIIVMSGILIIPLDNSFVFKIIGECSDVQKLIYEKLG
ncbi:MAG: hypothetical protein WBB70_00235, partial [Desulfobacterales bacterium]